MIAKEINKDELLLKLKSIGLVSVPKLSILLRSFFWKIKKKKQRPSIQHKFLRQGFQRLLNFCKFVFDNDLKKVHWILKPTIKMKILVWNENMDWKEVRTIVVHLFQRLSNCKIESDREFFSLLNMMHWQCSTFDLILTNYL